MRGEASSAGGTSAELASLPLPPLLYYQRTLVARKLDAPPGSYTKRLFDDHELLRHKLLEEAQELAGEPRGETRVRGQAAPRA